MKRKTPTFYVFVDVDGETPDGGEFIEQWATRWSHQGRFVLTIRPSRGPWRHLTFNQRTRKPRALRR